MARSDAPKKPDAGRNSGSEKSPVEATRRRRVLGRTHAFAGSLLLVAILLMVNYLAFRHYERWDWTTEGLYTLSDRTVQELEALERPIDIYLFLSEAERNFPEVRELLERYRAVTDRVEVQYVDPDRNPSEFRVLAQRFGIQAGMGDMGTTMADVAAVVTQGEQKWTITRDDLLGVDFESFEDEGGPKMDVKAEQALTGAVVQVTSGEPTKVCVSAGHGEWDLEGASERSLYTLKDELRRDNIETEALDTLGGRPVPEACDALFVVGPQQAFGEEEVESLVTYLEGGGNLLLALDPILERDVIQETGFEDALERLGVHVDRSVVLELSPERLLPPGNPAGPFIVADYGEHRTTEPLVAQGGPALVSIARSVRPREGSGATALVRTSEESFAETDLAALDPETEPTADPSDFGGPVPVAVAVGGGSAEAGEGEAGGRLVVVGDADWLRGEALRDPRFTNLELALAWTGWLTERETLISIPAKKIDAQPMMITEEHLTGLLVRLVGLMPAAMLLLGFAMWWTRRS